MEAKEFDEAKLHFHKSLNAHPEFKTSQINDKIGDIYFKEEKEWQKAKDYYLKGLLSAQSFELQLKVGKCDEKLRDFVSAVESYKKAADIQPSNPIAYFRLGWAHIRNNEKEEGLANLKKSLQLDPNNVDVLTKIAEVMLKDNESLDECIQYLKKALEIDPKHADALVIYGRALEKKGDIDEAIIYYEKATNLPNAHINSYYYLAILYEKRKNFKKSIQLFKQCLSEFNLFSEFCSC